MQSSVLTSDPKKSKRKHHEVITVSDEVISPSHYKEIKHIVDAPKLNVVSDDDYQLRMKELTEREQCLFEREKRTTPCIYPLTANYQSTSFPMLSSSSSNLGAPTQMLDSAMNSAQQMSGNSNISSNHFLSMLLSASNPIHGIHNPNVPSNSL